MTMWLIINPTRTFYDKRQPLPDAAIV